MISTFLQLLGDDVNTIFTIHHKLNNQKIKCVLRQTQAPFEQVLTDMTRISPNTLEVRFGTAPEQDEYSILIVGKLEINRRTRPALSAASARSIQEGFGR